MQNEVSVNIIISEEARRRLMQLKYQYNFKSVCDVIEYLLNKEEGIKK